MMEQFAPHLEMLPPGQRALLPELAPLAGLGFVLYGGTAIALQIGHRTSIDFDFFTDQPLDKRTLTQAPGFVERAMVIQDAPDTLSLIVPTGEAASAPVNVSFFGGRQFGRIGTPRLTNDQLLVVASLDDLMATKLKVLLQRVESKDYVDIAALIARGVDLARGLAGTRRLYGNQFQPNEALKALTYFEGGDMHLLTNEAREILMSEAERVTEIPQVPLQSARLSLD